MHDPMNKQRIMFSFFILTNTLIIIRLIGLKEFINEKVFMAFYEYLKQFLEISLYEKISIDGDILNWLSYHIDGQPPAPYKIFTSKVDEYCIYCGKESTFTCSSKYNKILTESTLSLHTIFSTLADHDYANYPIYLNLFCSRNSAHEINLLLLINKNYIKKIGQFPTRADFEIIEYKKYNKILKEKAAELARAIGLNSHGIGIGSFVYLRRIIEYFLLLALQESGKKETDFSNKRIEDKIDLVRDYIPRFLYENKGIYKILSVGIHELTEEECLKYFPVLLSSIQLILEERYEQAEKKIKQENIEKALQEIQSEIGKP